jgi:murein L,D-transpeptidase YafK
MSSDPRVATARRHCEGELRERCSQLRVAYPPSRVFIQAFKDEKVLEVWVGSGKRYALFRRYPIAAASGGPGPKRVEGDNQVPEGVYHVAIFNPQSQFLLSLGLNYPNASDRLRSDRNRPGDNIFIHGNRLSIGCMAMTDEKIEEIYLLALGGKAHGVPVFVFPCRMEGMEYTAMLASHPEHLDFWGELQPIYAALVASHRPPAVEIGADGAYRLVRARRG